MGGAGGGLVGFQGRVIGPGRGGEEGGIKGRAAAAIQTLGPPVTHEADSSCPTVEIVLFLVEIYL